MLLAWYSEAYPTRRACWKSHPGFAGAENTGQGDRRVLVINPEPSLGHGVEARPWTGRFATAGDLEDPPGWRPELLVGSLS